MPLHIELRARAFANAARGVTLFAVFFTARADRNTHTHAHTHTHNAVALIRLGDASPDLRVRNRGERLGDVREAVAADI